MTTSLSCGHLEVKHYAKGLCEKCYERSWFAKQRFKKYYNTKTREKYIKKHYGISLEEYKKILDFQGGVCALCRKPPSENKHYLFVDHCHRTKKVRGLLCMTCNMELGYYEKNKKREFLFERYLHGS